jgi:hypothetical protein
MSDNESTDIDDGMPLHESNGWTYICDGRKKGEAINRTKESRT